MTAATITIDNVHNTFESIVFANNLHEITPPDTIETIFDSSDVSEEQLVEALKGVDRIAIMGWSSQGPAHAQNIRDTITKHGLDIEVVVGLREDSTSREAAQALGFTVVSSEEAAQTGDILSMLISDSGQVDDAERYIGSMKVGSTLLFAHGFYLGWREQEGLPPLRNDINIVGVCPKGMGPSVRSTYEIGSGINSSFAIEQDVDGGSIDKTLAYSAMIGSPYTFLTTLGNEWRSDIFGERAVLLGGVHGIIEGLAADVMAKNGGNAEAAYLTVVQTIVGPITDTILNHGFRGLVENLSQDDQEIFAEAYNASYDSYAAVIDQIYESVTSGQEIAEVVAANRGNEGFEDIAGGDIWTTTVSLRDAQRAAGYPYQTINPKAAGMYVACMVAQIDKLIKKGHKWSEAVNESIIEAVASLNPYMKSGGVDYMVDNCSITARRGDRKWFGRFQEATAAACQEMDRTIGVTTGTTIDHYRDFLNHDVHSALAMFDQYRPKDAKGNLLTISVEVSPEKLAVWRAANSAKKAS